MPTRKEWLAYVASNVAGLLAMGTDEEAVGASVDRLSDAELARVHWAVDELQRRLYVIADRNDPLDGQAVRDAIDSAPGRGGDDA